MLNMSDCVEYLNVRYCFVNNTFIVGDNESYALISEPLNGTIFIPFKIGENEVKEIGARSFMGCISLEQVTIEARITQINDRAFVSCEKLQKINVPNTCTIIQGWGLQTYNITYGGYRPNPYKSFTIFFEPNSRIKYIDTRGISFRVNVNIYTCERINPNIVSDTFKEVKNLKIYSPVSFVFNNISSITKNYSSQCKIPNTIHRKCSKTNSFDMLIFVIMLS